MPARRGRHQPDTAASIANNDSTESGIAVSSDRSLRMKRCRVSRLCNAKSQRCLDSSNTDFVSLEDGKKCRIGTKHCELSIACNSEDPGSSNDVTVHQQLSDDMLSAVSGRRLLSTFFDQPCVQLARNLLGKYLVSISEVDGKRLTGRIVETEAYVGTEDRASHSYGGRRTARNEAMYMPPGTSYVYNIYGIYTCINISSRGIIYVTFLTEQKPVMSLSYILLLLLSLFCMMQAIRSKYCVTAYKTISASYINNNNHLRPFVG